MPDEIPFAARLLMARHHMKLSQEGLAERAGMKGAAISLFETGARRPSFDNLRKLADALSVTADFLLGRTDDMEELAEVDVAFRHGDNGLSVEQQEDLNVLAAAMVKRNRERRKN